MYAPRFVLSLPVLLLLAQCTGAIDESTPGRPDTFRSAPVRPGETVVPSKPGAGAEGTGPNSPVAAACQGNTVEPASAPIRRLTRFEYNNTVRDLMGDTTAPAQAFVAEEEALGFRNNALALGVTPLLAEQYMTAAEGLAERAMKDPARLLTCDRAVLAGTLTGAARTSAEDACARTFIDGFGKRAYRRPLSGDELQGFVKVFTAGRDKQDFKAGIELFLAAVLQSPHFFYRVEFGTPVAGKPGVARLDSWEVASRLSYLLWGTMPDDRLFAAAAAGRLQTAPEIQAEAQRMLAQAQAKEMVRGFHEQWLSLDRIASLAKDATVYPKFTPEIGPLLREETERFTESVFWESGGDLSTLLTAPFSFMNAKLARFYSLPPLPGDTFQKVTVDGIQRGGLLTQAGLLALHAKPNQTSPILRGKFIREQLLCQALPEPPGNVDVVPPPLDPKLTTRERFAQHTADPACAGCHAMMDPIGLGFENYDGAGLWRTAENGKPIDPAGQVLGLGGAGTGTFRGAGELAAKLASSDDTRRCMTLHWFRFGYGRGEQAEDRCTLDKLSQSFAASGYKARDLLLALTQTDAFTLRGVVVPQGVSP